VNVLQQILPFLFVFEDVKPTWYKKYRTRVPTCHLGIARHGVVTRDYHLYYQTP
jgi:hypothetical protein